MNKLLFAVRLILFVTVFCLGGCTLSSVKLQQLAPPAPTAKLRIHVVAVTSNVPPVGFWKVSPQEYVDNMVRQTGRMLKNRGMYEVVPDADIKLVMGDKNFAGWEWMRNDWELAQTAGKALRADYVLCIERSWKISLQQEMKMFNLHTGRQFAVSNYLPQHLTNNDRAATEMIMINYRTLFRNAQSDLLRTALNKGRGIHDRLSSASAGKETAAVQQPEKPPEAKAPVVRAGKKQPELKQPSAKEKQLAFEKEMEAALLVKHQKQDGARLIVYDFDAAESLRVVGLILTEALREELYKLGGFILINRENMAQVMEELKLQQSGLVNEKQAIKLGEWMTANEAVTGQFAVLGKSSVLQAKRINIKTLGTISLGSLKCKAGEEDELLGNMPELARKLTQIQYN